MQWLQSVFGSDGSPIVQYVSIFAVIFAVLTVIVLMVRRFSGGGLADARRATQRGRQPRLGIVDVYELDRQRQLILLRRDNVEHLLLVGGPNDVVIERHIQRGQQRDPSPRPEAMAEPLPEAFADAANGTFPGLETRAESVFQPDFAMPAVLAPAVPSSGAVPPAAHLDIGPLDAAEAGGARAAEAIVTGPRPEASGRRPMRRTMPPLINPRPDVASERPRLEPAPPETPVETSSESPALSAGPMPPMPPAGRRAVDPAVLSDMARQLEAALARPASAVTPPPAVRPAPPREEPSPAEPAATDPMAAAMATAPVVVPILRDGRPDDVPFEEPTTSAAPPGPEPEPFLPAPPRPNPAPVEAPEPMLTEPLPTKAETPREPPSPPAPKTPPNPFSVEEIEAEFARLLGRPLDKRS